MILNHMKTYLRVFSCASLDCTAVRISSDISNIRVVCHLQRIAYIIDHQHAQIKISS